MSNIIYFTSGKVGIGLTNPGTNYRLDQFRCFRKYNCTELYKNGAYLSSTLSLFYLEQVPPRDYGGALVVWPGMQFPNRWYNTSILIYFFWTIDG